MIHNPFWVWIIKLDHFNWLLVIRTNIIFSSFWLLLNIPLEPSWSILTCTVYIEMIYAKFYHPKRIRLLAARREVNVFKTSASELLSFTICLLCDLVLNRNTQEAQSPISHRYISNWKNLWLNTELYKRFTESFKRLTMYYCSFVLTCSIQIYSVTRRKHVIV